MERYIPAAIIPSLHAGHTELAELREISVLFVKCSGLNICADEKLDCNAVGVCVCDVQGVCLSGGRRWRRGST